MDDSGDAFIEGGIDLRSDFTFSDGDVVLVEYSDNLVQAVVNRLNTELDELDLFYESYGSVLSSFFGWRRTDETLGFVKAEVDNVLSMESRLDSFVSTVEYADNGSLVVRLSLWFGSTVSDVNLVLGVNGVELLSDELVDDMEVVE